MNRTPINPKFFELPKLPKKQPTSENVHVIDVVTSKDILDEYNMFIKFNEYLAWTMRSTANSLVFNCENEDTLFRCRTLFIKWLKRDYPAIEIKNKPKYDDNHNLIRVVFRCWWKLSNRAMFWTMYLVLVK